MNDHVSVIFMGIAGATVTALTSSGKLIMDRIVGWVVGIILCAALSTHTAQFLTSGDYASYVCTTSGADVNTVGIWKGYGVIQA